MTETFHQKILNQFISFYSVFNLQLIEQAAQMSAVLWWQPIHITIPQYYCQLIFRHFLTFLKNFKNFFVDDLIQRLAPWSTLRFLTVGLLNYFLNFLSTVFFGFFHIFLTFFKLFFKPLYIVVFSTIFHNDGRSYPHIHNGFFRFFVWNRNF